MKVQSRPALQPQAPTKKITMAMLMIAAPAILSAVSLTSPNPSRMKKFMEVRTLVAASRSGVIASSKMSRSAARFSELSCTSTSSRAFARAMATPSETAVESNCTASMRSSILSSMPGRFLFSSRPSVSASSSNDSVVTNSARSTSSVSLTTSWTSLTNAEPSSNWLRSSPNSSSNGKMPMKLSSSLPFSVESNTCEAVHEMLLRPPSMWPLPLNASMAQITMEITSTTMAASSKNLSQSGVLRWRWPHLQHLQKGQAVQQQMNQTTPSISEKTIGPAVRMAQPGPTMFLNSRPRSPGFLEAFIISRTRLSSPAPLSKACRPASSSTSLKSTSAHSSSTRCLARAEASSSSAVR
mmetsp:Transcript_31462/g.72982  ORF Transcript_31462/g.72982 Transcript_31462/m.72982 type:complete len:354 (+) Transcript_31462:1177-2238(+)